MRLRTLVSPTGKGAAAAAPETQGGKNVKKDIYQTITDQIVELLEQGVFAWPSTLQPCPRAERRFSFR